MTRKIDTIRAIASEYDVIVFDQWGVLHNGTAAYPDAVEAVTQLGGNCAVLSNSGKRSEPNADRISDMGFPPKVFQFVMTSGEAIWRDISGGKIDGAQFFAVERTIGDAAKWARGLGITMVDTPEQADAILLMGLPDGAKLDDWAETINAWRDLKLPVYCSNPDRQSPRAEGLVVSPGAIGFAYQEIGGACTFYGKPHLPIFKAMEEVLGQGRYLMVGDSMEHDIAGAHGAGWDSLLIQGGLYAHRFATGDQHATLQKNCHREFLQLAYLQNGRIALMNIPNLVTPEFRALSAELGRDPLQVQGPGGNTSIKDGSVMFIKASGTELADAEDKDIFVAVDRNAAVQEAREQSGDGSCKDTVLDRSHGLRPSIETTFHAALDQHVVAHTHSVATLVHAISPEGREVIAQKLDGMPYVMVPYAKPGLPLTRKILAQVSDETRVVILQNHGLICMGDSVDEVRDRIAEVEAKLAMDAKSVSAVSSQTSAPDGFEWSEFGWLATDDTVTDLVLNGTYYPDHVVFLGPGLPTQDHDGTPPAILKRGQGVLIKSDATSSQRAMLHCIADVFARMPKDWTVEAIGSDAEAELLDWDAEKYRQALAARA